MTAQRSRKQAVAYLKYSTGIRKDCVFCEISHESEQQLSESKYFRVIHNIFPYTVWDNQSVEDHLMLIPKMHTETLADLPASAALEFVKLISQYESAGYGIWARPPKSTAKSVPHQHTHLIKLSNKQIKGVVFITKPHLRLIIR